MNYSFSIPQNITVGAGCISKLPDIVRQSESNNVLIISGNHLNKMGVVAKVKDLLENAGIKAHAFTDVEANPSVETVDKAAAYYKECGSTSIVALGGGSPMDVAKAVGVVATYGGSIIEYEGGGKVKGPIVPLIAIPTTAGTGSEVTAFSVITDHKRNYKLTVFSYELLPRYALLDPELIMSLPANVAAASGVDALVHAIESYISLAATPFSDAMAEKAMELIGGSIRTFVANRKDISAAQEMLTGSMFAGIAFSYARLGNVHAMAHPLSGYFNIAHGVANAILLPTVLKFNALADKGKYEKIYCYVKKEDTEPYEFMPEMLVREIRTLIHNLDIPKSLSEAGVTEDKIEVMAQDAMKSGNIAVNPRQTEISDIIALYHEAM